MLSAVQIFVTAMKEGRQRAPDWYLHDPPPLLIPGRDLVAGTVAVTDAVRCSCTYLWTQPVSQLPDSTSVNASLQPASLTADVSQIAGHAGHSSSSEHGPGCENHPLTHNLFYGNLFFLLLHQLFVKVCLLQVQGGKKDLSRKLVTLIGPYI